MAAGQLGGLLYPTHEEAKSQGAADDRKAFGSSIEVWNRHNYRDAASEFREFIQQYPDSPWTAEAKLHIGCYASYNGRYGEAESLFEEIIREQQGKQHSGAIMLLNKARQRLALVKVYQNNVDEAKRLFSELMKSPDWHHRTYASHWIQRLNRYSANQRALLNCGTLALAHILRQQGDEKGAQELEQILPQSDSGFSMKLLAELAARYGYELMGIHADIEDLASMPQPLIVQVNGSGRSDGGHYWILEAIEQDVLKLFDPQSGSRFQQTSEEFIQSWEGYLLVFGNGVTLPGRRLDDAEMEALYGGCCGVPRKPDNQGNPERNGLPPENNSGQCPVGAPIWSVNMVNMNLFMTDTPMWYASPIGPDVTLEVSYNSQSSITYHEPFGNKWQFNYSSYLDVDPSGTVTIFMPDGRIDDYAPDGSGGFNQPYRVHNTLTKIADNHYELLFPDGTTYIYNIPSGTDSLQPFLVEIRDVYGQKVTLGYNANVQLVSVTDALNRMTALQYSPAGLVTNIADPFGRTAQFAYDANANLIKITDMAGYWTSLAYDTNSYLTGLADDRGTSQFQIESADGIGNGSNHYPPPGGIMWEDYRITVTDPMGNKEEFYYDGYSSVGWHVAPKYYVDYVDNTINNYASQTERTWFYYTVVGSDGNGELTRVTDPTGGFEEFTYNYSTGDRISSTDAHGHKTYFSYNGMGNIVSMTDPRTNTTTFTYATNGVDLLTISNGLGAVRMMYNAQHDLVSVADRTSNTTTFTYNNFGRIISRVDPSGITNSYIYDASNRLSEVRRNGMAIESMTYDGIGRLRTRTDATGLTLVYDYNNLNAITRITYPDGRHEDYAYSTCCPRLLDSATDRAGRLTTYEYDALKRLIQVVNPEKGVVRNEYDANGNHTSLADPNGNITTFDYDAANRLTRKTYADGNGLSFAYDVAGLLTNRTSGRGLRTAYRYDANHNLLAINYSDGTPAVTNTYDEYNRLVKVRDGVGDSTNVYDADSRLILHDGPWTNDAITYAYDVLGRRTNLVVQGGSAATGYNYDNLNRLTGVSVGADVYAYVYSNASPLVRRLNRPNGSYTTYAYDSLNRLTGLSNRKSTHEVINEFLYSYNTQDLRAGETVSNGLACAFSTNELVRYDYNNLNQVLTSTSPDRLFAYDADGNMTRGYTPSGYVFTAAYDAENRLSTISYTNHLGVVFSNVYRYAANQFLAEMRSYSNGSLTSQSRYVRDKFLEVQERSGANTIIREYAWGLNMGGGIGGLLDLKQTGQAYSCLFNGKGDVLALLDNTQTAVARYAYDAFGMLLTKIGSLTQPIQFSTKPYDDKTGLSYYGYRFYLPVLARWINRDPLSESAGPNLFSFVINNPVNWVDPLGLYAEVRVEGNKVTITIPIEYEGSGASPAVVTKFNKAIEENWSGTFGNYDVTTTVTQPNAKCPPNKKNTIQVPKGNDRAFVNKVGGNAGTWPADRPGWTAAHEAGHLIALPDQYTDAEGPNKGYEQNIMGVRNGTPSQADIETIIKVNP